MMPRQEDGSVYEFDVLAASERDEISREEAVRLAEPSPSPEGSGTLLGFPSSPNGGLQTSDVVCGAFDAFITDIPRAPALTLAPETAIGTAVEAMRVRRRSAAVVLRNHRPIGVITDRDILGRHGAVQGELRTIRVGSVMSLCPEPLRVRDTVATALKQMGGQRQWCLPIVCEDGLFLGALDASDICLWLGGSLTEVSVEAFFAGRS